MNFIQDPSNYHKLAPHALRAVAALCKISEFTQIYTDEKIQDIASTPPALCCSGEDSTVSRIIQGYKWATSPSSMFDSMETLESSARLMQGSVAFQPGATNIPFFSASLLEECVRELDRHMRKRLGFNYDDRLQMECQALIPKNMTITTPIEDFCLPIQNWHLNQRHSQCPMIGVALILLLIQRICLGHPELTDWTAEFAIMIKAIIDSQHPSIISVNINYAGILILENVRMLNEANRLIESPFVQENSEDEEPNRL